MRQSNLATKTKKEAPSDETALNAKLLLRAGFIHKEMAGVYDYLPLGLKVRNKIIDIIRKEMNGIDGQEIKMSALQDKDIWEKTDRWDDEKVDIWFKTNLHSGTDFHKGGQLGIAWSHESALTNLLRQHVSSYKDLPIYLYQFQKKFRNELRSKSGIMRGREFIMKDLYSFCRTEDEQKEYFEKVRDAYLRIFKEFGLDDITYVTYASGGPFADYSIEFQTLTDAGEDIIFVCEKCKVAVNKEMEHKYDYCPECSNKDLVEKKAAEVGNIFNLGTQFSEPLGLAYKDENGKNQPVWMGSYGIGIGRLMGTLVEVFSDDNGLVWPINVAPYSFHLLALGDSSEVDKVSNELYKQLKADDISVLFDDRDKSPGEKFADADLIGIPYQIIIGEKGLQNDEIEIKVRKGNKTKKISRDKIFNTLNEIKSS